jgi:hypothetical protein
VRAEGAKGQQLQVTMTPPPWPVAAAVAAVIATACQPGPGARDDREPAPPPQEQHAQTPATVPATDDAMRDDSAAADSLSLRVVAPAEVSTGELVPMMLHVRNITDRPLDLYLRGRVIAFDLVVTDAAGAEVWRRLAGEVIPAILRIETLAPGGVLELRDTWDQRGRGGAPVPPGSYSIRGELLTEDGLLASPAAPLRIGAD